MLQPGIATQPEFAIEWELYHIMNSLKAHFGVCSC